MFKKNQRVVKIFSVGNIETASIVTIKSVSKGFVRCEGDEHLKYDPNNGRELDPVGFGFSSRLVVLEE